MCSLLSLLFFYLLGHYKMFDDARNSTISGGNYSTPFGTKRLVYTDWTASARAHQGIEDFIQRDVLPFYGNTHDHHSLCGHQSTAFREEARQVVAQATNAKLSIGDNEGGKSKDVVIFAGTGATGATNKLVHILGLHAMVAEATRNGTTLPVILVGPFEHHSNLLPWRETGSRVLRIKENEQGQLDLLDLESRLIEVTKTGPNTTTAAAPPLIVGTFAAASNVTGVLTDVDLVTALLHRYNALAIFDYATAGPYVPMDMNPPMNAKGDVLAKDAIIFSPHKFLGGVNTPGVLVVKKSLCINQVPSSPGGGTVFYVTENAHRFLSNRSEREEGGTPDIVGTIRAGLACQLKTSIGIDNIYQEEMKISTKIYTWLKTNCQHLILLGPDNSTTPRLPIFSFLIRAPKHISGNLKNGMFLHYNYVTRLLNDVFGIQARGGCACAGPYAQDLLGMSSRSFNGVTYSDLFETSLLNKNELLRPGFTRLSFPWMLSEEEVEYVCHALQSISTHGWRLLPQYKYDHASGEWSHKTRLNKFPNRIWLSRAFSSHMQNNNTKNTQTKIEKNVVISLKEQLKQGISLLSTCDPTEDLVHGNSTTESMVLDPLAERLRWFVLPSEVRERMTTIETEDVVQENNSKTEKEKRKDQELSIQPKIYQTNTISAAADNTNAAADNTSTATDAIPTAPSSISPSITTATIKTDAIPTATIPTPSFSSPSSTPSIPSTLTPSINQTKSNTSQPITAPIVSTVSTVSTSVKKDESNESLEELRAKLETSSYRGKKNRSKRARLKSKIHLLQGGDDFMNNAIAKKRDTKMSKRKVNKDNINTTVTNSFSISTTSTVSIDQKDSKDQDNHPDQADTEQKEPQKPQQPQQPQQHPGKSLKKLAKLNQRRLLKEMGRAISDWSMIKEGDRILVGVSGGKDSLTLLHLLLELKKRAPIHFEVGAVTVDPGTDAFDPRPLIPYMKNLGVPYYYENQDHIFLWAEYKNPSSICSFCARMKRGRLYACCRREGYNVLALGQHLDDLAESFLMGAFLNGELRAMKACFETFSGIETDTMKDELPPNAKDTVEKQPIRIGEMNENEKNSSESSSIDIDFGSQKYSIEKGTSETGNVYYGGAIRVVRPLVYVREHETREFARYVHLPVINENCPACFEAPKERRRIKKLLAQQESLFPATFKHLRRAMVPLMSAHATRNLQDYAAERLQSGRVRWDAGEVSGVGKETHGKESTSDITSSKFTFCEKK